jgi:hypothetical protein
MKRTILRKLWNVTYFFLRLLWVATYAFFGFAFKFTILPLFKFEHGF